MIVSEIISRVQNGFGDSNQIIIRDPHVIDWINEGMVEIVRETQCLSKRESSIVASAFNNVAGVGINDMMLLKRVYYGNDALLLLDSEALDRMGFVPQTGIPKGYYMEGSKILLFPTPTATDATQMTIFYVPAPVNVTTAADIPGIPFFFHGDLAEWCLAKAHERNENFRAAELIMNRFRANLSTRKFESLSQDDSYRTVQADVMDMDYYGSIQ